MRRFGTVLVTAALSALVASSHGRVAAATGPRLTAITATRGVHPAILIEASEPVAYATTRPDPFTVIVDLRNVVATGYADGFAAQPGGPVQDVDVETLRAEDGAPLARVRVTLSEPVGHRVRSQRNLIFVELDPEAPLAGSPAAAPVAAAVVDRATVLGGLETHVDADGATVLLTGNGLLAPSAVQRAGAHRLYLDFPGVAPGVAPVTPAGDGPIDRVRVALHSRDPLVTRVVVDLRRPSTHALEWSDGRRQLRLSFRDAMHAQVASPLVGVVEPSETTAPQAPAPPEAPAPRETAGEIVASGPPQIRVAPAMAEPAAQAAGDPARAAGEEPQEFTGHPISLDFQGADLRAVLRTFAEISGLNIVIDPAVQGSVDVALRDVPWDQALDIILRANKLGYTVEGTIVRVAPLSVLAEEQKQRRTLAEQQALSGELHVETITLSYATAEQMKPLLVRSALTQRGTVEVDSRTNTLIVTDLAPAIERAVSLVKDLDQPQPQVEIEARIVRTSRNYARELGIQWGFTGRAVPELGNTTGLAFPSSVVVGGALGDTGSAVNLPTGNPPNSAVGLALGAINGAFSLDARLSALESSGDLRILSTPRVTTQNNVEAEITQGTEIPIQTVANNTVTVSFKPAALTLRVTPQITSSDTVIMRIQVENANADFDRMVNGIPPINTQRANTRVLVSDGETTVIGGIYESTQANSVDRTPGLSRIPLLGWLFRNSAVTDSNQELLIFITPRIIRR